MMRKILALALITILAFSLASCDIKGKVQDAVKDAITGDSDDDKVDAEKIADKLIAEAESQNAFSAAAADAAMKTLAGLGLEDVKPDFAYILDDDTKGNYGDSSSYGHAQFFFIKDGSDVTKEEYEAWLKKVYDATAAVSDDGRNIQGFGFGEGDVPKSFEDVLSGGFMQVWSYKYNGVIMDVYPSTKYGKFTVSEDKVYGADDSSDIGVIIDITVGMQKGWSEYEEDISKAFEEHGDEIEQALKDYAGS